MTGNHFEKKFVRSHARRKNMKCDEALSALGLFSDDGERVWIPSVSRGHVRFEMVKCSQIRRDLAGSVNQRLSDDLLMTYVPLLSSVSDGWKLTSFDGGYAVLSLDIHDQLLMTAGEFLDGEPNVDFTQEITESIDKIAGLSFSMQRWNVAEHFDALLVSMSHVESAFVDNDAVSFRHPDGTYGFWEVHIKHTDNFVELATDVMNAITGAISDDFEMDGGSLVAKFAGVGMSSGRAPKR